MLLFLLYNLVCAVRILKAVLVLKVVRHKSYKTDNAQNVHTSSILTACQTNNASHSFSLLTNLLNSGLYPLSLVPYLPFTLQPNLSFTHSPHQWKFIIDYPVSKSNIFFTVFKLANLLIIIWHHTISLLKCVLFSLIWHVSCFSFSLNVLSVSV